MQIYIQGSWKINMEPNTAGLPSFSIGWFLGFHVKISRVHWNSKLEVSHLQTCKNIFFNYHFWYIYMYHHVFQNCDCRITSPIKICNLHITSKVPKRNVLKKFFSKTPYFLSDSVFEQTSNFPCFWVIDSVNLILEVEHGCLQYYHVIRFLSFLVILRKNPLKPWLWEKRVG